MRKTFVTLTVASMALWFMGCTQEKAPAEQPPAKAEQPAAPAVAPAPTPAPTAAPVPAPAPAPAPVPDAGKAAPAEGAAPADKAPETKPADATGAPKAVLQFYIMSQCPFGVQVLNGVIPALKKLGKAVDFRLDFIGEIQGDALSSMHGENEVAGNIVELCTIKYATEKWYDMFMCWNKNFQALPGNWKECAKEAALDDATLAKVTECVDGKEGKELLKASFQKAQAAGAQGSPTIYINGGQWSEGRDEIAFLKGICATLAEPKPEVCTNLPKPAVVTLLVVNDKRCTDKTCQTEPIISSLKQLFPGLEVKELDWGTPEGKAAYADHGLELLPALIFDESVSKEPAGQERVAAYFKPSKKAGHNLLMIEAYHDPNKEICDNKVDDTADGKVDCDDEHCKEKLVCRTEIKGDLQVFVMTHCPFGIRAMNAMKDVLKAFGTEIKFDIHFIVTQTDQGFEALHGQIEVDESIRQLCIKKLYPENYKFMDYIWCRAVDMQTTTYEKCLTDSKMEQAKVDECIKGEGKELLLADAKLSGQLGMNASPTWLVNNKTKFPGIDPAGVQQGICGANPEFNGCKTPLQGNPPPTGAPAEGAPSCG